MAPILCSTESTFLLTDHTAWFTPLLPIYGLQQVCQGRFTNVSFCSHFRYYQRLFWSEFKMIAFQDLLCLEQKIQNDFVQEFRLFLQRKMTRIWNNE